jgi:hypothetical protein
MKTNTNCLWYLAQLFLVWEMFKMLYRVSIKFFPDYKNLLQENYVEYQHFFLPLFKLVSKILYHVFIVTVAIFVFHVFFL